MKYQPGQTGNPNGRPKGSFGGRTQALLLLDKLLLKAKNKRALSKVLQAEFNKDPLRFFSTFVMPLLPKETKVSGDGTGVVKWESMFGGKIPDPPPFGHKEPAP